MVGLFAKKLLEVLNIKRYFSKKWQLKISKQQINYFVYLVKGIEKTDLDSRNKKHPFMAPIQPIWGRLPKPYGGYILFSGQLKKQNNDRQKLN